MNILQVLVYAGLTFASLFLITGFSLMIFGRKTIPDGTNSARIEVEIFGQSLSVPYQVNIVLCIIGALLLFLTFNLYNNAGSPSALLTINQAYAQPLETQPANSEWVYFGYEKDPKLWNFEILNGSFNDLISRQQGIILRSTKNMNIREEHFGNFTGTIVNFLTPAPKVIGQLPAGSCVLVTDFKSVGFSKIWVKIELYQCPDN